MLFRNISFSCTIVDILRIYGQLQFFFLSTFLSYGVLVEFIQRPEVLWLFLSHNYHRNHYPYRTILTSEFGDIIISIDIFQPICV